MEDKGEAWKELVRYAYTESEFYRKKLQETGKMLEQILEDWDEVPVIHKDEMVLAGDSVVPYKYYSRLRTGRLSRENTSGSTGKCLTIYWDHSEMARSMLPLWLYRKKYYGILPQDKYCYFYTLRILGGADPEWEQYKTGLGFSKIDLTSSRIERIYNRILEYQPSWLLLQPSVGMLLARHVFETGAELIDSLRYIELTGEMFTESTRNFIKSAFGVPVASQYGCNEANSIAYECPEGKLHVMSSNVHVDIWKDGQIMKEGEEGKILITSWHNRAMPFIKYDIGDYGKLFKSKCSCGGSGEILQLTAGRTNDQIAMEDGESCSIYEFIRAFRCVEMKIDGELYQYQIIQKDFNCFEIHIVAEERKEIIETLFLKNIHSRRLKEAEYTFVYHDRMLPEEGCGKLKMFHSEVIQSNY